MSWVDAALQHMLAQYLLYTFLHGLWGIRCVLRGEDLSPVRPGGPWEEQPLVFPPQVHSHGMGGGVLMGA